MSEAPKRVWILRVNEQNIHGISSQIIEGSLQGKEIIKRVLIENNTTTPARTPCPHQQNQCGKLPHILIFLEITIRDDNKINIVLSICIS